MQKPAIKLTLAVALLAVPATTPCLAAPPTSHSIFVSEMKTVQEGDLTGPGHSMESETTIPEDAFGQKSGHFHPFVTVTANHSDNIYRTRDNPLSDWVTTISPGLWLAAPSSDKVLLSVSSENAQPAGLGLFLARPEGFNRYQAYALYGADLAYHTDYTERDNTKQAAEVFFQYNLRGGLSFNVYDKWIDSEELMYTTGSSSTFSEFANNLAGALVSYDVTEKLSLRGDINFFTLDYDNVEDKHKSRSDNAFSLYGFYNYSAKTSLFIEYRQTGIEYDNQPTLDSTQNGYYGGIQWKPTISTRLIAKAGSESKDYDTEGLDSLSETGVELQLGHSFSEKSNFALTATQKLNETLVTGTDYQIRTYILGAYKYRFTDRINGLLNLGYEQNDFVGLTNTTNERTDDIYSYKVGANYNLNNWLSCKLLYGYNKRESTDYYFNYDENTISVSLSTGM
ncbi:MAG: outer membrane beta-barrel protein [Desulfobulbaceae bacterium]|nr:outer membrane beta-barrel protein [Desulfobulbaceae bacterium]